MRRTKRSENFFLCLLLNVLLNLEWSIPAWILLVLHFVLDWSIWWFWGALGLWLLWIILCQLIIGWSAKCSSEPEPVKENKNPYSAKNSQIIPKSTEEKETISNENNDSI